MTLMLRSSQSSAVVTGHQQITPAVSFDVDGYWMERRSLKQTPFVGGQSVFTNGNVSRPDIRSYAITPTIRIDLPGNWQGGVNATLAESRTVLHTTHYFNGVASPSRLTYRNRTSGVEANAEGSLFSLPGGDARIAVGAGLRRVSLHDNITRIFPDHVSVFRDFTEARDVQFAYGELSIPLFRPELNIPLVERLTVSGALRYERWRGIDTIVTPKLGLIYEPSPDVTIRGTWGRSFKAPTLDQISKPLQGYLIPSFYFSPQPQPPLPANSGVLLLGGGSPHLRSERATTWSATIELKPRIFDGLHFAASYFHVNYRDRIVSPLTGLFSALANSLDSDLIIFDPTADQVRALVASFPEGLVNETGQPFDPANVGAVIDDSLRNAARQKIRGVDLSADYRVKMPASQQLLLTGAASYLESNQQLTSSQPAVQMAGIIFNPPHWRWRAGGIWQNRAAEFSAFINYVGAARDNRYAPIERIGPFTTLDLNAAIHLAGRAAPPKGLELRLSALNILNEKPDVIRNQLPTGTPYDSTNQTPVGRFIGASIREVW